MKAARRAISLYAILPVNLSGRYGHLRNTSRAKTRCGPAPRQSWNWSTLDAMIGCPGRRGHDAEAVQRCPPAFTPPSSRHSRGTVRNARDLFVEEV